MLRLRSHPDLDFSSISGSPQLCHLRSAEPIPTTVKQNTKDQLRGCWGQEARHVKLSASYTLAWPLTASNRETAGSSPWCFQVPGIIHQAKRPTLSIENPLGFPCVTQRFSHCSQINMCSFEIKAKERMIASLRTKVRWKMFPSIFPLWHILLIIFSGMK